MSLAGGKKGAKNMARAAVKTKTVTEEALPSGVKLVDKSETPLDEGSIRLLIEGWEIKRQMDELKARLDAINGRLIEAHGTGCALVVSGLCRASLVERESVRIEDAERLKGVLGFRFTDLVRTEVIYKPEQKLIEMAVNADEPLAPSIRQCLTVGKSHSVTWRAEK